MMNTLTMVKLKSTSTSETQTRAATSCRFQTRSITRETVNLRTMRWNPWWRRKKTRKTGRMARAITRIRTSRSMSSGTVIRRCKMHACCRSMQRCRVPTQAWGLWSLTRSRLRNQCLTSSTVTITLSNPKSRTNSETPHPPTLTTKRSKCSETSSGPRPTTSPSNNSNSLQTHTTTNTMKSILRLYTQTHLTLRPKSSIVSSSVSVARVAR